MEVWEKEKCFGNTSHGRVLLQVFKVFLKQLDYELEISTVE